MSVKEECPMIKYVSIGKDYDFPPLSLAIGLFDGLHKGHQSLLEEAKKTKYQSGVLTFSFDWKTGFKGKEGALLIENEKQEMLHSFSIDNELILPFDEKTKNTTKKDFLSFLLSLNAKKIVVGEDFTFGKDKEGKANDILSLEKEGVEVKILPLLQIDNEKVSSTRIRSLLHESKIEEANKLLGYPFFYQGKVLHGKANGRKISFPTANINLEDGKFRLKNGVYMTRTYIDTKPYLSMTNIGNHPTVDKLTHAIIETNIFDIDDDLYEKDIKIEFLSFVREEKKFSSLSELEEQLKKDKESCQEKESLL